jgi:hypothetical protein
MGGDAARLEDFDRARAQFIRNEYFGHSTYLEFQLRRREEHEVQRVIARSGATKQSRAELGSLVRDSFASLAMTAATEDFVTFVSSW